MAKLLSVPEAAELLSLSVIYVYKLVEARRIPHVRVGKRVLLESDSLLNWIAARRVPAIDGGTQ